MINIHSDITIRLSTTENGSLRSSLKPDPEINDISTRRYITRHNIKPSDVTLLRLSYETSDFCKYHEVEEDEVGAGFTKPQEKVADALVTHLYGVVLFLPIADCIGAVLYHPPTRTLMLSHLGRHNLEQDGGMKSVAYLEKFGVDPTELLVYLSPAAGKAHYPLFAFGNRSLHDVAVEQLQHAGVAAEHIAIDSRDTVTDPDFFSHSATLRGEKPPGRHAIMCYIK